MGFTTGFLSGATLTLSALYLSLLAHQSHRARQSAVLQSGAALLQSITDPDTPTADAVRRAQQKELNRAYRLGAAPSEAELASRGGLVAMAKERWNREVEGAVRWAAEKDWGAVREQGEGLVRGAWRSVVAATDGEKRA